MSKTLVAIVAVPLGLAATTVLAACWTRRRFSRRPEVFACRVRPAGPEESSGWPRSTRYAYWIRDVLVVHRGFSLVRSEALPIMGIAGPVSAVGVKGLGDRPMWLRLHLQGGRILDLVARNQDVVPATGPFVTASMRERAGNS